MINGYWTALASIMLVILLLTGWGNWIDQRLRLIILVPSVCIIWCFAYFDWKLSFAIGASQLTVELSFILICFLILLYDIIFHPTVDMQLVVLYTLSLCVAIVMIRAFLMYAPWAGASMAYWHLPFLTGLILGLLNARFSQLVLIVYLSLSFAEVLLIWQQGGEYEGIIGSLRWWDDVAISISGIVVVRLIIIMLQKLTLHFTQLLGKRMKS